MRTHVRQRPRQCLVGHERGDPRASVPDHMMLPFSRGVTCRGRCYHGRNYYGRKPIPQQGNPARSRPLLVSGNEFVEPGDRGRFFPVLRANATRPLSCAGDSPAEALACIRRLHDRVRFLGRGREPFAPRVLPCVPPHRGRIFAFSRSGEQRSVCIGSNSGLPNGVHFRSPRCVGVSVCFSTYYRFSARLPSVS